MKNLVAVVFLLLSGSFCFAKDIQPKNAKPSYHMLDCQGRFGDPDCHAEIYFGGCKEKITLEWLPAQMKPSPEWKDKNQSFCKVVLVSASHETLLTINPTSCKELFRYFSNAGQIFPETKWLDHACRNGSDVPQQTASVMRIVEAGKEKTWERAVRIEEILKCHLRLADQKNKTHRLECPVLLYSVAQWLEGFLAIIGSELQVRNELK